MSVTCPSMHSPSKHATIHCVLGTDWAFTKSGERQEPSQSILCPKHLTAAATLTWPTSQGSKALVLSHCGPLQPLPTLPGAPLPQPLPPLLPCFYPVCLSVYQLVFQNVLPDLLGLMKCPRTAFPRAPYPPSEHPTLDVSSRTA